MGDPPKSTNTNFAKYRMMVNIDYNFNNQLTHFICIKLSREINKLPIMIAPSVNVKIFVFRTTGYSTTMSNEIFPVRLHETRISGSFYTNFQAQFGLGIIK